VDSIIAGRLPASIVVPGLDAISVGSYITWFILIAMTGLGIGGQALIARAMGAGDTREAHAALGQAVMLGVAWGVVVGLALWLGAPLLGALCRLSSDATALLTTYVRVVSLSMPLAGVMLVGAMCLHGAGETTLPSLISVGVNVVNVVASWALSGVDLRFGDRTLVNPFSFDWNVAGIAAGTSLGYLFGAAATAWVLRRGVKDLRLDPGDVRPQRAMSGRIVRVGLPGFLDSLMMWSVNLLVLLLIGMIAVGAATAGEPQEGLQGAHLIAIRWESFSFLPGFAMGTAAGALAGQYLGAGRPDLARRAVLACTGIGCVLMGGLGVVFMVGGEWLTAIISTQEIHLREAPPLLFICGLVQVFFATTMVMRQALRGAGDTRWSFLITTASSYGVRLPAAWLFGVALGWGLTGIWIGLCGELVVRAALFTARFLHRGWERVVV
jgi:putative MATE family efflux protein